MTPKPLSKEDRYQIRYRAENNWRRNQIDVAWTWETIQALLSAEAFWREAVKKATISKDYGMIGNPSECMFCHETGKDDNITHTTGCPWRLAQE